MAAGDLCTLEQVKAVEGLASAEQDARIAVFIGLASKRVAQYMAPDKFTKDVAATVRFFQGDLIDGELLTDPIAETPTQIRVLDATGTVVASMVIPDDIVTLPRNRDAATEPITALRFRPSAPSVSGYEIEITAKFGWPAVPGDVVNATIETVRDYLRWNQSTKTQDRIQAGAGGFVDRDLTDKAKQMLHELRGYRVA